METIYEKMFTAFFDWQLATTVLTISFVFLMAYWFHSMPKNLPPGPHGLPIAGYLPFMSNRPEKTFTNLGKKYGAIFKVYLGNQLIVILNDYEAIKEAFVKQADTFIGRPESGNFSLSKENNLAVTTNNGPFWRDHRRFALTFFKDCGVGNLSIEPRVMEEIHDLIAKIKTFDGKPTDMKNVLSASVANNICLMMLGKRFKYEDSTFLKIKHLINEFGASLNTVSAVNFFPWLKYIPGIGHLMSHAKIEQIFNEIRIFISEAVKGQKEKYIAGERDNYINAYFTEQHSRLAKENKVGNFNDGALINNIRCFMNAGTEPTANTILWGIIYMIIHPDVQKKVQDELDGVIGAERDPSWNDRFRTPYTEATIFEIQRKASLVPLNLPHSNIEECTIFGYKIPKDTIIISNLANVLSDPKLWGDPENFRPERFLSKSGKVEKPEYFIPFSIGKRDCLGEVLAHMELYLYFTSLLQSFTFQTSNGKIPSTKRASATNLPMNFVTCAILRNK